MSLPPPLATPEDQPPLFGAIKIIQVNLNHCKAANEAIRDYIKTENIDIALLQDAYCNREGALSDIPRNYAILPSNAKSAHLVIQNTNLAY